MNTLSRWARSKSFRGAALGIWLTCDLGAPLFAGDPVPPVAYSKRLNAAEARADEEVPMAESEDGRIRLNLFNVTWPTVLESVAKQSGSTLILQDTPPGRFTRLDRRRYDRREAVALLNRELTPLGYRILENGDHLMVLHERTLNKNYRPAVLPSEESQGRSAQTANAEPQGPTRYQRQFDSITPVPGGSAATSGQVMAGSNPPGQVMAGGNSPGQAVAGGNPAGQPAVLPAGNTSPRLMNDAEPRTAMTADHTVPDGQRGTAPAPLPAEPTTTLTVPVGRSQAVPVARLVHESFGRASELVDAGPTGLPAFRIRGDAVRGAALEVEIDAPHNLLLVTGTTKSAGAMAGLLRDIDRVAADPQQMPRIMPANDSQLHLAEELRPMLAQIAQANQAPQPQPAGANPFPSNLNQPAPGAAPQTTVIGGAGALGSSGELPALVGNLRGDVSVEAVPDLGVLILRGNQADVDQVLEVIRTLEQLSAGQTPAVELLKLQHVDSSALAELLTEVYGRLATVRNRGVETPSRVVVLPVGKPNSVIVLAPEAEMEAILELASELDQPVDPTAEFQVLWLKHAPAEQVAALVEQFYAERPALGARVKVAADLRTNSLIVAARPRDLAEITEMVRTIDRNESASVSRMKVYPLQSATAEELAAVITAALATALNPAAAPTTGAGGGGTVNLGAGGGATGTALQAARSTVLEYLDATGETPTLLRSGILANVRVTPDPRTNSLLVTADERSLPLIEAIISRLDRPSAAVAEIKVFTLENSDATGVAELLETLFQASTTGGNQAASNGIQLVGAQDAGSNLVPLRFGVDVRTNSVIATGGPEALRVVEAVLLRLDESDVRQRETTVMKLKNSYAPDVALAINEFLTSQRDLATIDPDLVSNVELLEREVIVVPDIQSNSLLISSTPRYYDEIVKIVNKLDEAPPQVIIQAMLVEVDLANTDELGIELGFQDTTLFDRSVSTAADLLTINQTTTAQNGVQTTTQQVVSRAAQPGFNFNNANPLGNNVGSPLSNPGAVAPQGLTNFALGRANADLGYGGFVFSASSANVSVLLRALSAKRTIHILSRPQVRALDNQIAQIQVGQNVPVVNGVTVNQTSTIPQIVRDNAGLILTVVPRISPDGTVVMEVTAERSAYTGEGVPVFTDVATGSVVTAPIKDITTARTTVSVPTGQTIVMGGIITRADDTIERKVPYFGDIPYLGQLFRYDSTTVNRRELLIFLTPRVIYNDADNELIKQVESDRLHFIEHEAEMIHGPLYGVPPAQPIGGPTLAPPMLGPDGQPIDPNADVLPGLPAGECPPGWYPPGTLYPDEEPGIGHPSRDNAPGVPPLPAQPNMPGPYGPAMPGGMRPGAVPPGMMPPGGMGPGGMGPGGMGPGGMAPGGMAPNGLPSGVLPAPPAIDGPDQSSVPGRSNIVQTSASVTETPIDPTTIEPTGLAVGSGRLANVVKPPKPVEPKKKFPFGFRK